LIHSCTEFTTVCCCWRFISAPPLLPLPLLLPLLPQGIDAAYWRMREAGFAPDGYTFRLLLDAIKAWSDLEGELAQQAQQAHDAQQAS
jgi:hypothetical protein